MDLTIYSEVFILIDVLLRDVLRDHLVGHIPGTAAEIPARPQVPPPELLLQMRILR
jgi:hypothetical protein